MGLPFELFLAWRYLRFNSGRTFLSVITWISIAGVAVGTSALVIALALNAGFAQDIRERIHGGSAHLNVMAQDRAPFEGADALISQLDRIEGVQRSGAAVFTPAMLTMPAIGDPEYAEVMGVDPDAQTEIIREGGWEESPFPALELQTVSGREAIVVGGELARRLGVVEGDELQVLVPELNMSPWGPVPRQRTYEVVGVFESQQFQQNAQRAYVHRDALGRQLKLKGKTHWVQLRLDDLRDLEPMKAKIQSELGDEWRVIDLLEWNAGFLQALNLEKLILFLAIGLIVVVASLNIVSTLILTVNDKVKEIGTLSAMGAGPRDIAVIFVIQGFVVGAVGVLIGLPLGAAAVSLLDYLQWPKLDPEVYYLTHVPFALKFFDLFVVGGAALVIALLATIYPATRAARLKPVEALRYE